MTTDRSIVYLQRWHRWRYGEEPSPEAIIRVSNAGILLPLASAIGWLTMVATILHLSLIFLLAHFDLWGPLELLRRFHIRAVLNNFTNLSVIPAWLTAVIAPFVWWWVADRDGWRRRCDTIGLALILSLGIGLVALGPALLAVALLLWIIDARHRLSQSPQPRYIELAMWRWFKT